MKRHAESTLHSAELPAAVAGLTVVMPPVCAEPVEPIRTLW